MRHTGQANCGERRHRENRGGRTRVGYPAREGPEKPELRALSWVERGDEVETEAREMTGQEKVLLPSKFFWPYFLLHSIPIFLPSPTPPTHSQGRSGSSVTGSKSPGCSSFSPMAVDEQADSSPLPGRTETTVCVPSFLELGTAAPPQAQLRS